MNKKLSKTNPVESSKFSKVTDEAASLAQTWKRYRDKFGSGFFYNVNNPLVFTIKADVLYIRYHIFLF